MNAGKIQILIAEDDDSIREGLQFALEQEGYGVTACSGAVEAKKAIQEKGADLYLLDVTLPDGSGYELCRLVKQLNAKLPIIFLTACDAEVNVVMGLDMGADDYIVKPFRIRELASRIRSVLRRCDIRCAEGQGEREQTAVGKGEDEEKKAILFGNVEIHPSEVRVFRKDGGERREVRLTALEYKLLLTFARHPGQVLSREQLLEHIWDSSGDFVEDNTVSVYIKRLREKLEEDVRNPKLICTVRGLGYRSADRR